MRSDAARSFGHKESDLLRVIERPGRWHISRVRKLLDIGVPFADIPSPFKPENRPALCALYREHGIY